MFVVAAYDTPNDRRRLRFAKILLDYGYRVQKSVFEAEAPREVIQEMIQRLDKVVDQREDSIRIYHVCQRCLQQVNFIGQAELTNQETVFIV